MTSKADKILQHMEAELVSELKTNNKLVEEWFRSNDRIKKMKSDLLKAYLAVMQTPQMNTPKFTPKQIADWKAYEEVRSEGRFNMFDPRARQLTGLSKEEYVFVMDNFEALAKAAEQTP